MSIGWALLVLFSSSIAGSPLVFVPCSCPPVNVRFVTFVLPTMSLEVAMSQALAKTVEAKSGPLVLEGSVIAIVGGVLIENGLVVGGPPPRVTRSV